jgi:hypothetical protein
MRAEGVECHVAVGKQIFASFADQSYGVGKYAERKGLRELFDGVKWPLRSSPSTSRSPSCSKPARSLSRAERDRTRVSTPRVRVCRGGSASRMMLGGRQGFSWLKFAKPAPWREQYVCQSLSAALTVLVSGHAPDAVTGQPDYGTDVP